MMALPLPDKPSIAVLPFENLSGDPEYGYCADGMVEDITTALSRIRWLFVIARNSSFTYKGRSGHRARTTPIACRRGRSIQPTLQFRSPIRGGHCNDDGAGRSFLAANPNFAKGWHSSGQLRLWAGQYDLAIEHFETSIRLSPQENRNGNYLTIGIGHFFARRTEKTAEMLGLSLQGNSEWPPTLRFMASCLAHLGRLKEAQELVKRLQAITPVVIPTAE
jgi:tetratricopeptide (TPR) repeat protein